MISMMGSSCGVLQFSHTTVPVQLDKPLSSCYHAGNKQIEGGAAHAWNYVGFRAASYTSEGKMVHETLREVWYSVPTTTKRTEVLWSILQECSF